MLLFSYIQICDDGRNGGFCQVMVWVDIGHRAQRLCLISTVKTIACGSQDDCMRNK